MILAAARPQFPQSPITMSGEAWPGVIETMAIVFNFAVNNGAENDNGTDL